MKILVLAPHGDDEVLGCGGTIAKYSRKHKVHVCYITEPFYPKWSYQYIDNRLKETDKVKKLLNIHQIHFLCYETCNIDKVPQMELNDRLKHIIDKIKPEVLLIPDSEDTHKDHRLVHESAVTCMKYNDSVKKVLSYEVPEARYKSFTPNVYVDISKFIDDKKEAMKIYGSELRNTGIRSLDGIETVTRHRGYECGCKYAEGFKLVREIYEI